MLRTLKNNQTGQTIQIDDSQLSSYGLNPDGSALAMNKQPQPTPTPQAPAQPGNNWNDVSSRMAKVAQANNFPPSVLLGQAALETGHGKAAPGNNYFGMKGGGTAGSNNMPTKEAGAHGMYGTRSSFGAYNSPEESALAYINLIKTKYPQAYALKDDPVAMVQAIHQGGYATDPQYVSKVVNTPEFKAFLKHAPTLAATPTPQPGKPNQPYNGLLTPDQVNAPPSNVTRPPATSPFRAGENPLGFMNGGTVFAAEHQTGIQPAQPTPPAKPQKSVGGFFNNLVNDVGENVKGLFAIPQVIGNSVQHPETIPNTVGTMAKGIVKEYGDLITHPGDTLYNKPLSSVLDVLPAAGAVGKIAGVGKAAKVAELAKEAEIAGAAGNAAGDANILKKAGTAVRSDVSKIRVEPSLYGPAKEAAVQQTLNNLGIKGNAAQQYEQLLPRMQILSDHIEKVLQENPKTVPIEQVKQDFLTNLKSDLRTENITSDVAKQKVADYIQRLYDNGVPNADGTIVPKEISTEDLFQLKKLANEDYKQVVAKISSNQPLTPMDRVISAARQTMDDIIAREHPEVKNATVQQSHLYDAVDSLSKQRDAAGNMKIAGIPVPNLVGVAGQNAKDAIGNGLLAGGDLLDKVPGASATLKGVPDVARGAVKNIPTEELLGRSADQALGFAPSMGVAAQTDQNGNPSVTPPSQFNVEKVPDLGEVVNIKDASGNVKQVKRGDLPDYGMNYDGTPNPNAQGQSNPNAPHTLQEYNSAIERAMSAGPRGRQYISGLEAERNYFYPQIASKQINPSLLNQKNLASSGLRSYNEMVDMLKTDPNSILKSSIFGSPGARKYKAAVINAAQTLVYLRSGKQINEKEAGQYATLFPQPGDSPDTVTYKMNQIKQAFQDYLNVNPNQTSYNSVNNGVGFSTGTPMFSGQ